MDGSVPTLDETRFRGRLLFVLLPERHDLQRSGAVMQHLVHKVLHRFLSWPGRACQCGVEETRKTGK